MKLQMTSDQCQRGHDARVGRCQFRGRGAGGGAGQLDHPVARFQQMQEQRHAGRRPPRGTRGPGDLGAAALAPDDPPVTGAIGDG